MQPRRPGPGPGAMPSAALAGAVDLAALKARSDAAARAADAPPPAAGSVVIDVTEATFQAEVLDRSFQVPVLIDLWAEWCQPCKQLSPILEKLAHETGGTWILAKIDVDANPRIQQALQVQSIPSVFAVIGGQLVPGFQGALPEAQVREFVAAVLEAGAQAGLSGAVPGAGQSVLDAGEDSLEEPEAPGDPRFTAAEDAIDTGEFDVAIAAYEAILAVEPANEQAQLARRQVGLMKRASELPEDALDRAAALPKDVAAQLQAADFHLVSGDVDSALAVILAAIKRVPSDERPPLRERMIEYFDLLGPDDPRVPAARRALANALF